MRGGAVGGYPKCLNDGLQVVGQVQAIVPLGPAIQPERGESLVQFPPGGFGDGVGQSVEETRFRHHLEVDENREEVDGWMGQAAETVG